eukprot:g14334.t1
MEIKDYGLSRERGYLSHYEIDEIALPSRFDGVTQAAGNLSGLMSTGRVRHWLDQLDDPVLEEWAIEATEEEVRTAMVHYSFLVQSYVWGEATPPAHLPANLARPMVAISDRLGQAPLLPYSGYVLDNWARLDKSGPISLDNIYMYQNFAGGDDENWFVMIHVAIEAEAGVLLDNAAKLVTVAKHGAETEAERLLVEMDEAWERIYDHFARMTERCDPYVYFHRVRPYIHGWANNPALEGGGLIYEGVEKLGGKPQALRGQTGSQSSIVPAMDALFQAARFRTRHLEYAASYINKQAGSIAGNDPDVGTGGTPFMKYLKKHRDENRAQVVS